MANRKGLIYKMADRLGAWHRRHMGSVDFVHVMAVFIGLLCGLSAGLLKKTIGWMTELVFNAFHTNSINWMFLVLPIVGILLATLYATYINKHPMEHGSEKITKDIATNNNRLSPNLILGPIIGATLTLGFGGSAGGEGPIAYTGGAIGSNVGKAFKLREVNLGKVVGCGAAAAIAGIFMAPIGGVMYALEVLRMKQDLRTILAIVLASLTAALTCYIVLGCHTDITFVPAMRFDLHLIPWVLLCGVFCGIYSVYYRKTLGACRWLFGRIANRWVKALTGGVIMAVLLFLFPSLYGEGYNILHKLMIDDPTVVVLYGPLYELAKHPDILVILIGALLIVKPIATSATNDSGGIGGSFTPTFFCGGVAGFLFAFILNRYFGMHVPSALFAFFGMSAVMTGAIKAPLMAIFIAAEMTGLYGFILPLTLASVASFAIVLGAEQLRHKFSKSSQNPESSENSGTSESSETTKK